MKTLIKGGRVLDPASGKDGIYNILIEDGIIVSVDTKEAEELILK